MDIWELTFIPMGSGQAPECIDWLGKRICQILMDFPKQTIRMEINTTIQLIILNGFQQRRICSTRLLMDSGIRATECLVKRTQMREDLAFECELLRLAKFIQALLIAQKQSMGMIGIFATVWRVAR